MIVFAIVVLLFILILYFINKDTGPKVQTVNANIQKGNDTLGSVASIVKSIL